uniref:Uncharacterized protein n=1 Tax=Cucumis melo TaxID=3656 RepID=A0A9I9E8K7_CUCME
MSLDKTVDQPKTSKMRSQNCRIKGQAEDSALAQHIIHGERDILRHTTLETIRSVYSFMTKLPKKIFNSLREVIHPNDRIKIPFRRLESTYQAINHTFHTKHR